MLAKYLVYTLVLSIHVTRVGAYSGIRMASSDFVLLPLLRPASGTSD